MTTKQYLNQARTLDMEINSKLEELHQLKLKSVCVSNLSEIGRVKSTPQNTANKTIDKIVDLEKVINEEIDRLVDLKTNIHRTINRLSDVTLRTLLTEYYINCKSWEQVAECMNYELRNIYYLHGQALKNTNPN